MVKNTVKFIYIGPSNRGYDGRIDYMFISDEMCNHVLTCNIIPAAIPDHTVIVHINLHANQRGPGYWKMNINIIDDDEYICGI